MRNALSLTLGSSMEVGGGCQDVVSYIPNLRKSNEQFIGHALGRNTEVIETVIQQAVLKSTGDKVRIWVGKGQYFEIPEGAKKLRSPTYLVRDSQARNSFST